MPRHFPVTLVRNDGHGEDFRRWTVYHGNTPIFDIEATAAPGYQPIVAVKGRKGGVLGTYRPKPRGGASTD